MMGLTWRSSAVLKGFDSCDMFHMNACTAMYVANVAYSFPVRLCNRGVDIWPPCYSLHAHRAIFGVGPVLGAVSQANTAVAPMDCRGDRSSSCLCSCHILLHKGCSAAQLQGCCCTTVLLQQKAVTTLAFHRCTYRCHSTPPSTEVIILLS